MNVPMGLTLYAEIVLAADCFVAGVWFWSLVKSPAHLLQILSDERELGKFLQDMGLDAFRRESAAIYRRSGTFEDLTRSCIRSFEFTRARLGWMVALFFAVLVLATHFVSPVYHLVNLSLFLLPCFLPPGAYTENNNFSLVYSVALNLYRWNLSDPDDCRQHCTTRDTRFRHLYSVVGRIPATGQTLEGIL